MRLILKVIVCLSFLSATALGQEVITKMMAGPSDDNFRVIVSFIAVSDDSYDMQSLIIDINRLKNKNDEPAAYYADLTTTHRSLATGGKKQRILVIRWEKSGAVEVKCEGGKWAKQTPGAELDKIVETVKAVVKSSPLDAKSVTEFKLSATDKQKVRETLKSLETSSLTCIRGGS